MNAKIVYFSGTGSTKYVAEAFESEFKANAIRVHMQELRHDAPIVDEPYDLLVLCYVVHACNAPRPVMEWVKGQMPAENMPVAVISVSGGGEVTPNLACRVSLIRELKRKNFKVVYEKMLVMPSNWIVATKKLLIDRLLEVLPRKVEKIVSDLKNGETRHANPGIGNRIISLIGRLEGIGARQFGKRIQVGMSCTGCSLCAKACPAGNIEIVKGKPEFGGKCLLCLACLYGCPQKALSAGIAKFILIEEGFSFPGMLANRESARSFDIKAETKGFLWLGVRRYLLDDSDSLEPAAYRKN